MSFQPYPIVPFQSGLEKDQDPFLLKDDAFPIFNDCYQYLGKIERRGGSQVIGRLVQYATITYAAALVAGNTTYTNTLANVPISPGSVIVTVVDTGAATVYTFTDDGAGVLSAGAGTSGTISYSSGVFVINFPALPAPVGNYNVVVVYEYHTGRPVMGLRTRETNSINQENLIAFDTVKSNLWNTGTRRFDDISYDQAGTAIVWSSTDSDFFWSWNYYTDTSANKLFWVCNNRANNVAVDGIWIYNGTAAVPGASGGWYLQTPQLNSLAANRFLNGCLILIAYRDRMVALNTLEGTTAVGAGVVRHSNRARWSQNGVPYTTTLAGADATAWYDTVPGKGGYIDAPTSEQIVSCGFYKDTLIVFFERSTWQLVYTGNEVLPFVWQRVNTQLGAESTFSVVEFDKGIFAVGDKAIIQSDSYNVERIDQKIPEEVFSFHNQNDGPKRVHGIRDFYFNFVYWTFPNLTENRTYPNRLLVLNYKEGSYSIYNESVTCLGYFQDITDATWATLPFPWSSVTGTWSDNRKQADFPSIVGGNQQGFVFMIEQEIQGTPTLYITGITQAAQAVVTSPNHNLVVGQYVKFSAVEGMTEINTLIGKIVATPTVNSFTVDINSTAFTAYTRSGLIQVLYNMEIVTKRFNPFFGQGKAVRSPYFDMYVERTSVGEITADIFIDDDSSDPITSYTVSTTKEYGPLVTTGKVWQRIYTNVTGQFLQFKFYLNDTQMRNTAINQSDVTIHAMNAWLGAVGRLQSYVIG